MRNLTQLAPSLDDLVHLPARLSEQAKAFVYHFGLDDIFGRLKGSGAYLIAENTANRSNISASLTKKALAKETLSSVASSLAGVAAGASPGVGISGAAAITGGVAAGFEQGVVEGGLARLFSMTWQAWKGLGGVLPYVMSKWAFVTLLMVCAINAYISTYTDTFPELPRQSNPILRFLSCAIDSVVACPARPIPTTYHGSFCTDPMAYSRSPVSDIS